MGPILYELFSYIENSSPLLAKATDLLRGMNSAMGVKKPEELYGD